MAKKEQFVTDEQWKKIEPLLPAYKPSPKGGRKPRGSRKVFEGIARVLRSGARWKDLPKQYPSPTTCWRRLQEWEEQGIRLKIWRKFLSELDKQGQLEWEETFADGGFAGPDGRWWLSSRGYGYEPGPFREPRPCIDPLRFDPATGEFSARLTWTPRTVRISTGASSRLADTGNRLNEEQP